MAPPAPPSHSKILEITIISAEDLAPVSRDMKTYAMAWVNPDEKLATRVDETGGTDPIWNDKFNFKVEDKFLDSEDAAIVVEIYAAAWVKDALIGYLNVLIKDIFHMRSIADANIKNSAPRTVALQVRRPSGRPQGILNVQVTLFDVSKPQVDDSKPKATTNEIKEINDDDDNKNDQPENKDSNPNAKISRSQSNGTDLKMEDSSEKRPDMGSMVNCGSSEVKGNGSMVNGDSLCNSDVGPSASVVAAAIAKGLYVPPVQTTAPTRETRKITEWTRRDRGESLDMKLERWRTELSQPAGVGYRQTNSIKGKKSSRGNNNGMRLFSCFGDSYGCEISISCGGSKKRHGSGNGNNKICHLSSVDDNYSQSVL